MRGLIVLGGVISAALVPRTMGPATYGRYELVTMVTFWFTMLAGLGMGQVVSRQTPQLIHEGAKERLAGLLRSLLVLRTLASVAAAFLYLLITRLWLQDLDPVVLVLLSAAVLLRGPANLCFSLFLGQGRIGRWAVPEVVRQWGSVVFSLPCFLVGGLRGAVAGYLISETVIFTIAFVGARGTLATRVRLRPNLAAVTPLLRVGMAFFAADMVLSACDRSGAILVRSVTQEYAQVGLFEVSYQIYLAAVLSTGQIAHSFVPLLTVLRAKDEQAELRVWVTRMVKWLTLIGCLAFLGSLILGRDIVPLVLGQAYVPVIDNLVVLSSVLLLVPLVQAGALLALTHDRPMVLLKSGGLRLLCVWSAGVPLISRWQSLGACLTVLAALAVQAGYLVWASGPFLRAALGRWLVVVVGALCFAPIAWLRSTLAVNVMLYLCAAGGYLFLMRAVGTISAREFRTLLRTLGIAKAAAKRARPGDA